MIFNPRISLLIGVIAISIFPVLVKWAPVSGISSAFYRMAIAVVFLLPYVLLKKQLQKPERSLWFLIFICGILFGSDIAIWNLSIHYSNATQATLLTNLSPVWVGIGSAVFLNDHPGRHFWIGTIVALAGMVILMGLDTFTQMKFDKGFLMAVMSGLLYASYMIVSKRALNRMNIVSFMTYSMIVSSLYLFIVCLVMQEPLWNFTPTIWGVLSIQGLICQLLGWLTISYAVQKLDAQRVSLSLLSQSIVTGLLAWIFINEKVSFQMIVGGIIILIGIGITFMKKKSL
ncbi:DMT family transporter [Dyadobacter sp. LHD-138]|uniref:DMT family transporter n=1 Tax=Dyadobacter sp. LHD-138 TaxID=3071413 RepID=UPI0027E182F4|nr:DMT family transporter [Dyadobacter sp. LHD-138]MDQ6481939.1 DMT family transporter [Dyadobacter sp. LHD-138]